MVHHFMKLCEIFTITLVNPYDGICLVTIYYRSFPLNIIGIVCRYKLTFILDRFDRKSHLEKIFIHVVQFCAPAFMLDREA